VDGGGRRGEALVDEEAHARPGVRRELDGAQPRRRAVATRHQQLVVAVAVEVGRDPRLDESGERDGSSFARHEEAGLLRPEREAVVSSARRARRHGRPRRARNPNEDRAL